MEKEKSNLRNRSDGKLINNNKGFLKCKSKSSYMLQKIFDKNLVAIRKRKVILILSKSAGIGMCILDLSKILIYKFHYDYIKNKYGSNS